MFKSDCDIFVLYMTEISLQLPQVVVNVCANTTTFHGFSVYYKNRQELEYEAINRKLCGLKSFSKK